MSTPFVATYGPIIIEAKLWGPTGDAHASLALDTGATSTVINAGVLVPIGYDPALAQTRSDFAVVCHDLPPTAAVDGVLGLDLLRNQCLTFDFGAGLITLA